MITVVYTNSTETVFKHLMIVLRLNCVFSVQVSLFVAMCTTYSVLHRVDIAMKLQVTLVDMKKYVLCN